MVLVIINVVDLPLSHLLVAFLGVDMPTNLHTGQINIVLRMVIAVVVNQILIHIHMLDIFLVRPLVPHNQHRIVFRCFASVHRIHCIVRILFRVLTVGGWEIAITAAVLIVGRARERRLGRCQRQLRHVTV